METRNILPSQKIIHPLPKLPDHLLKCSPDPSVLCSTMNCVPASSSLLNKMKLPLAIHLHPFKDMKPKVNFLNINVFTIPLLIDMSSN